MPSIRQPIVVVMGHVDHGKTSLLDRVRKTTVAKKEVGGITQHIGASEVPISVIKEICGPALQSMKIDLKIPGLLFIDTPGHEAFTNLRKRGGSIADIAVLVIDIAQGFQPQTLEAISILREYKTPFIVALNKIDLINGWRETNETSFSASFAQQRPDVQAKLDELIYSTIGRLYERGFEAERFDRIADHSKQIAIVPVSAKSGEGITELLMLLAGLSQRFLEQRLKTEVSGPGRGSILEVKEEAGLGTTIDVILYDGTIHKNDIIVFATVNGGASAKVRSLLKPKPMREMMRDSKDKFDYVDEVGAASGVKISAPGLEGALAGSELFVVKENEVEEAKQRLAQEVKEVLVERASAGVIVKADTLGSLEALTRLLEGEGILVKKAGIGTVGKRDVVDADAVAREDPLYGVILVFNSPVREDARQEAEERRIPIMHSTIIYTLIDDYKKWRDEQKKKEKEAAHRRLVMPAKIKVLEGCCFHASKPCIVGVEVLVGKIAPRVRLLNESGKVVGEISEIQKDGKPIGELKVGEQAAIALPGVTFDRGISYNEVLYSYVPKEHMREWREKYAELLAEDEKRALEEIENLRG